MNEIKDAIELGFTACIIRPNGISDPTQRAIAEFATLGASSEDTGGLDVRILNVRADYNDGEVTLVTSDIAAQQEAIEQAISLVALVTVHTRVRIPGLAAKAVMADVERQLTTAVEARHGASVRFTACAITNPTTTTQKNPMDADTEIDPSGEEIIDAIGRAYDADENFIVVPATAGSQTAAVVKTAIRRHLAGHAIPYTRHSTIDVGGSHNGRAVRTQPMDVEGQAQVISEADYITAIVSIGAADTTDGLPDLDAFTPARDDLETVVGECGDALLEMTVFVVHR